MTTIKYKGSECLIYEDFKQYSSLADVRKKNGCTGFYFFSNYTVEDWKLDQKKVLKDAKKLEYTEGIKILQKDVVKKS